MVQVLQHFYFVGVSCVITVWKFTIRRVVALLQVVSEHEINKVNRVDDPWQLVLSSHSIRC